MTALVEIESLYQNKGTERATIVRKAVITLPSFSDTLVARQYLPERRIYGNTYAVSYGPSTAGPLRERESGICATPLASPPAHSTTDAPGHAWSGFWPCTGRTGAAALTPVTTRQRAFLGGGPRPYLSACRRCHHTLAAPLAGTDGAPCRPPSRLA